MKIHNTPSIGHKRANYTPNRAFAIGLVVEDLIKTDIYSF
jgi:hypothetical protein